jgi:pilus assembly protein CpaB
MKKNLAPLIGIAFVVAIISTGIFYGLFVKPMGARQSEAAPALIVVAARDLPRGSAISPADVKLSARAAGQVPPGALRRPEQAGGLTLTSGVRAGDPVTESHLASASSGAGAALGVPSGMRAVSVYVNETSGVLAMLKPGHRVDVQVVKQRGEETELRAVLENIQVLNSQPHGDGRNATSVVTLLATPAESDMLALADSGARVRLALRNPLDDRKTLRGPGTQVRPPTRAATAPPPGREALLVRVAAATPSAVQALSGLSAAEAAVSGRIAPLSPGWEEALVELERTRQVQVLSSSELTGERRRRLEAELKLTHGKSLLITGIVGDLVMLVATLPRP